MITKMKLFFFFALFSVTLLFSQEPEKFGYVKYECRYLLKHQPDSTNNKNLEEEEMILFLGRNTSKFQSLKGHLKDSIFNKVGKDKKDPLKVMAMIGNIPKTKFKEVIYKNHVENKIIYIEELFRKYYKYEDSIKLFKWEIHKEKKLISGYECQKATTNYAGRNYTAWFTNKIPFSEGPYKFNGLPGLIVKIFDAKNHYDYTLIGFKVINHQNVAFKNMNYINISKVKFQKLKKETYENAFNRLEEMGITLDIDNSQKRKMLNRFKKRNNPIELRDE